MLDRDKLDEALAHFALDGLRYFDKYDSEALRPYIIFQAAMGRTAIKCRSQSKRVRRYIQL